MAEFDICGIEFSLGSKSKPGRTGKTIVEHKVPKAELLDSLNIKDKVTFVAYDYKTGILTVKEEKQ